MKKIKKLILLISVPLFLLGFAQPALAYDPGTAPGSTSSSATVQADSTTCEGGNAQACLDAGTNSSNILKVVKVGLNILGGAIGLTAVIMLIFAGIQYSVAGGDASAVAKAKSRITNVVIGLLAYVFLYAFLQWLIPGGIL